MKILKFFLVISLLYSVSYIDCYEKPIFFTSIYKSGTHLLGKCLSLLLNKKQLSNLRGIEKNGIVNFKKIEQLKGKYVFHKHLTYSKEALMFIKKGKFISFFMYRDPRDQLVSAVHWIYKNPRIYGDLTKLSVQELLTEHLRTSTFIDRSYYQFMGWLKESHVCAVKFEDLVGPKGGGDQIKQVKEILKIMRHLGIKETNKDVIKVVNNLFGDDKGTFRKGQIGSWKKAFTNEHKKMFKKVAGQLLIDLGYEKDLNW